MFSRDLWIPSFPLQPDSPSEGSGVSWVWHSVVAVRAAFRLFADLLASASCALQHLFQATCLGLTVPTWAKLGHATG